MKNTVDKTYRLLDDRSGETFMLKVGRDKNLVIFDNSANSNRTIRHCLNETSIFLEEQSIHAVVHPIIFEFGILKVPSNQPVTQTFLDNHPDNAANGGRWFELIDEEGEAKEDLIYEDLIIDIKQAVRDKMQEEDGIIALSTVASVITGSFIDIQSKKINELKRIIYNKIDSQPRMFVDDENNVNIFDDDELHRKYIVLQALHDNIIKKSANTKSIQWVKTNKIIATAPAGLDLIDYFTDYLTTDEGMLVLEEIKRLS